MSNKINTNAITGYDFRNMPHDIYTPLNYNMDTTKEMFDSLLHGGETVLTAEKFVQGMARMADIIVESTKKNAPQEGYGKNQLVYATTQQLADMWGVDKGTMIKGLKKLVAAEKIKVYRFPSSENPHPRYKIAEVEAYCLEIDPNLCEHTQASA